MQVRYPRRSFLFALGAAPLSAGEFWKKKEFSDWSAEEMAQLLSDSPWAKSVKVSYEGGSRGGGRSGGGGGWGGGVGIPGGGGGIGFPGGGRGGSGRGGGGGLPQGGWGGGEGGRPRMELTLLWASAVPVRAALLYRRLGTDAGSAPEVKTLAEDTPDHYVLELSGLPPRMLAGAPERLTEELHSTTSLNRKNKAPVSAGKIEMKETEQAIIFKFPKHPPIELGDKEVEFHSRLGPAIFQRIFRLKPMIYGDELAL